jgi:hypothetical protein
MGNAKASARGTGDSTATHAFFVYAKTITLILIPCLGMLQEKTTGDAANKNDKEDPNFDIATNNSSIYSNILPFTY